jgi:hypothetical protein
MYRVITRNNEPDQIVDATNITLSQRSWRNLKKNTIWDHL